MDMKELWGMLFIAIIFECVSNWYTAEINVRKKEG